MRKDIMRRKLAALAGLAAFALAPVLPAGAAGCGAQQQAIVGGKDRQPTPSELQDLAAQGDCPTPSVDTSRTDADEVDQLYNELLDQTAKDRATPPDQPQP
jgi:hypothetical protein